MGDLLRLLIEAGRVSRMHALSGAVPADGAHECEGVTVACPAGCLGLSARVLNTLRNHLGRPATVRDVLRLLRSDELAMVRNIGPRRIGEVRTALVAAGFPVPRQVR